MQHLLKTSDICGADYALLIERTRRLRHGVLAGADYTWIFPDAVLATAFCEPSTRTYGALEQAAARLGMRCTGFLAPTADAFIGCKTALLVAIEQLGSASSIVAVRQNLINPNEMRAISKVPTINCGTVEHVLAAIGYLATLSLRRSALVSERPVGFLGITPEFYDHFAILRVLSNCGRQILIDPCEAVFGSQADFFAELRALGVNFKICSYDSFKLIVDTLFVIVGPDSSTTNIKPFSRRDCAELRTDCMVFYSMPVDVSEAGLSWTIADHDLDQEDRIANGQFLEMLPYSAMAAITYLMDVDV
jgi:hypothetical protein